MAGGRGRWPGAGGRGRWPGQVAGGRAGSAAARLGFSEADVCLETLRMIFKNNGYIMVSMGRY